MSKTTKTSTSLSPISFSISGGPSSKYSNGSNNFQLNKAQQDAYDYAQNSFAENLPNINVFSPETLGKIDEQVQAYKNNALQELNDVYAPMLRNTMNDAAKRFGNLDNSVYLQNLDAVENKRAKAVSNLAQDVASKQNELVSDELSKRYAYLNFLNDYQNQIYNNAIQAVNATNRTASSGQSSNSGNSMQDLAKVLTSAAGLAGLFV